MKTLKYKYFLILLITLMVGSFLASCGEDEETLPEINNPANGGNDTEGYKDPQIKALIREHVSVEGSYRDYAWSFHIESTLHNELPGRIKFGVGHGDINGTTSVSWENNVYSYTYNYRNGTFVAEITNPFFFYYYFGKGKYLSLADNASECEFYYASFAALIKKGLNYLSSDERDLYNSIVDIFKEYEPAAKRDYRPSVWVSIDNKNYLVKEF